MNIARWTHGVLLLTLLGPCRHTPMKDGPARASVKSPTPS